jgi:hypothetical protein
MPDWAQELLLAVLGSTTFAGAVGWWFKSRREDRKEEDARKEAVRLALEGRTEAMRLALEARVEKLNDKVESLLRDAIAREREVIDRDRERIDMDAKQNEVISAATTALKEATVVMAALKKPPHP